MLGSRSGLRSELGLGLGLARVRVTGSVVEVRIRQRHRALELDRGHALQRGEPELVHELLRLLGERWGDIVVDLGEI